MRLHYFLCPLSAFFFLTSVQAQMPLVPLGPPAPPLEAPLAYPFHDETPLFLNEKHGRAYLTAHKTVLKPGETLTLNLIFKNTYADGSFYNPYFMRLIPLPGMLAIYDAKRTLIGDLIEWQGGSQTAPNAEDWTFIPEDSYIGFKIYNRPLSYVNFSDLKPGTYYLQMIYFTGFAADPPAAHGDHINYGVLTDRHELFRSNIITIRLLEAKPKVPPGLKKGLRSGAGIISHRHSGDTKP